MLPTKCFDVKMSKLSRSETQNAGVRDLRNRQKRSASCGKAFSSPLSPPTGTTNKQQLLLAENI